MGSPVHSVRGDFYLWKVEKIRDEGLKQKGECFNLWPKVSNGCKSLETVWLGKERERERVGKRLQYKISLDKKTNGVKV